MKENAALNFNYIHVFCKLKAFESGRPIIYAAYTVLNRLYRADRHVLLSDRQPRALSIHLTLNVS